MKRNCNASSRSDVQGGWRDFAKGFFITLAVLLIFLNVEKDIDKKQEEIKATSREKQK